MDGEGLKLENRKKDGATVRAFLFGPVFFLLLWMFLLRAQNPGLMSDDSGEMAAAAYRMGLPHPPGYPLFDLLGRLFTLLPVGTVAFRLNLFSALLSLGALGLTLEACRRLAGSRPWSADFAGIRAGAWMAVLALFFMSCRSVFAQSLTAKGCIYTLTLFLGSWILLLALASPKGRTHRGGWLLLFLWALGMTNHWQTSLLWLPFLGWWTYRSPVRWTGKHLLFAATFLLVGLSLYLYLPLRASLGVSPCWGHPTTLGGFGWVVSRGLVAGLEPWVRDRAFYGKTLAEFGQIFWFYWCPGFSALAVVGMVRFWKKDRPAGTLLLAFFLPVLAAVFLIHQEKNIYLVPEYLVSLAGVFVLFGFAGLGWVFSAFRGRARGVLLLAAGLGALAWMFRVSGLEDKSRYTLAEDFGTNVLRCLPEKALLLADGDHYVMPVWYEKYVRGRRPDVVFEPSVFLYHDWGWRQLARQSEDYAPALRLPTFPERLEFLEGEWKRHPFFYSLGRGDLSPVLDRTAGVWVPDGLVSEWSPRLPAPGNLEDRLRAVVSGERWRGLGEWRDAPGLDFSSGEIYRYYARQFYEAAQFFSRERSEGAALAYFERGLGVHPEAFAYNDTAVILGRMGYPEMARRLCVLGLQEDPGYLPAYLNMAECFMAEGNPEGARQCYREAEKAAGPSSGWSKRLKKDAGTSFETGKGAFVHRSPADYRALSAGFQKQGLPLLSSIAASTAAGMRSGEGR